MPQHVTLVHFNHSIERGQVSWPDLGRTDKRPNYGDMLVCASLLNHLPASTPTKRLNFGKFASEQTDFALIRGSTYLHNNFDYETAIETIKSIDGPLTIIGLGAQSAISDPKFLDNNSEARTFIELLNDRSKSISVRGSFTAEVVSRLGAKNVRITGCPSLFYTNKPPQVYLPELLKTPHRRLGVSLHSGLRKSMYCNDPDNARIKHGEAIRFAIDNSSKASLFEQGVKIEYDIADIRLPFQQRIEAAEVVLEKIGISEYLTPIELLSQMVSVKTIDDWLNKVRDIDAIFGFRFHGNMIGLLQSIPCYYWVYDSRLLEFCELYNLPWQSVSDGWQNPVTKILDHNWDKANKSFLTCYDELKKCYNENGLENSLP